MRYTNRRLLYFTLWSVHRIFISYHTIRQINVSSNVDEMGSLIQRTTQKRKNKEKLKTKNLEQLRRKRSRQQSMKAVPLRAEEVKLRGQYLSLTEPWRDDLAFYPSCLFDLPPLYLASSVPRLSYGVVCVIICLAVLIQYRLVTGRQTDRPRDGQTQDHTISRASIQRRAVINRQL